MLSESAQPPSSTNARRRASSKDSGAIPNGSAPLGSVTTVALVSPSIRGILAAAAAGDGFGYTKPDVGLKRLWRPGVVSHGAPPPGGMIPPNAGGGPGAAPGR